MDIPCIQSWAGLSVTDLTVNYIEDGTESMRLVIPEGQSGTLNVKTLRYNEGKIVSVSCEPESGTARSPKLTLEIHHQGVTWIDVDSNALVRVSGVVALESADVSWNGYLDMSQAEIRSESFQTSVFQQSICRIGDMAVSHFKLSQGEDSRLYAENIRCEKQMSIFLRENCVAELKGQAGYLKAYLLDSAKLQAAGLQVKQADCICTLKSDLACHAQELNYYQSGL